MNDEQLVFVIDEAITVKQVFDDYNWDYYGIPGQTRCPIHKLGQESKPSARVYEDGSLHCFTCGKSYKATEVLAAVKRVDRKDAARILLEKYPISSDKVEEYLKLYRTPKRKSVDESILDCAENALQYYRHKVPLENYREWCKKKDELLGVFIGLSKDEQLRKFYAFKNQLDNALSKLL